jgi:two-component system sensor histidine kinase and response regulator WspE
MQDEELVVLFFKELNENCEKMTQNLLSLEKAPLQKELIDSLMRTAHSIKGGAKVVGFPFLTALFHTLEECFLAAKNDEITIDSPLIDLFLQVIDTLQKDQKNEKLIKELEEKCKVSLEAHRKAPKPLPPIAEKNEPLKGRKIEEIPLKDAVDNELVSLFFKELRENCEKISQNLLELEKEPTRQEILDNLMRTAHSVKGGAKVVHIPVLTELFHSMEDCFVAAKARQITVDRPLIDLFLQIMDTLEKDQKNERSLKELSEKCQKSLEAHRGGLKSPVSETPIVPKKEEAIPKTEKEQTLKIDAAYLDRLARLAGGTIIDARWLQPFREGLTHLRQNQHDISALLEKYREAVVAGEAQPVLDNLLRTLTENLYGLRDELNARFGDFELFQERHTTLSERLYQEVLAIRMRPFEEGIRGIPRQVRDLSHSLGKEIELRIVGEKTPVDREILERLENPITHLVRNAIDHGIEKKGTIILSARHRAGLLEIQIKDNGRGIDFEAVQKEAESRHLIEKQKTLSEKDLENFILQPGFTTKKSATDISGRGFGLDVVREVVQQMGGRLKLHSEKGKGVEITMTLPLTLSLLRALIVEVDGEPYAFPLSRIDRAAKFMNEEEVHIPLLSLKSLLKDGEVKPFQFPLNVVLVEGKGLVVDDFLGEKDLVVQELDPRLGKIEGILAGALLEDGSPLLILDTDELSGVHVKNQRILVVDDSPTIREMHTRILLGKGYEVDTAYDGRDGLTHVKAVPYDLVITDLSMPEMDGFEMIQEIRRESRFKKLPIVVISSRSLEEDIALAHKLGANRYLVKGSFEDETLIKIIEEFLK